MKVDDNSLFTLYEQDRDAARLLPSELLSIPKSELLVQYLLTRVHEYDPVQLLTGLTFPNLLLHPADSHPTFVEYLQHLILTHTPSLSPADATEEIVSELFRDVKNVFGAVSFSYSFHEGTCGERSELQNSMATDSLGIRGKSYLVHQLALLERLLGSIDTWLQSHLEVGAEDFLRTARYVFEEINHRANTAITEMRKVTERPRNGLFGMVLEHDIFRLSPPDESIERVLRLLSASPGSKCAPASLLPGHVWAISRDFPILYYRDIYYCFNPQPVVEELPRLVSEWIAENDKRFFDRRYARMREGVLTEMTLDSLAGVFPGAVHGHNLYYGVDDSSRSETDAVLLYDDIAIVIEAKAGALSFSARKGSEKRIKRDFGKLVGDAFSQARRAADFILGNPNGIFTDERGNPLLSLDNRPIRKVYLLNPVLDSMDAFAIELADARESGLLSPDENWPWCVFINDLQLVTDILDTPSVFLLYLDRRLRFNEHSNWFRVHDEIDLLDYFIHTGLFLEKKQFKGADMVQWQADTVDLDSFYAAKFQGLDLPPKPYPPFLPDILALVQIVEQSGVPSRTALAAELLGLGEDTHRKVLDVVAQLPPRLEQRKVPQSGSFIREGLGMSLWFAFESSEATKDRVLLEDGVNKHDHKLDTWLTAIFVVQGDSYSLADVTLNTDPWCVDPEMDETVRMLRNAKYQKRKHLAKVGRNAPCPCGSGKKFKKCHGR